MVSVITPVHNAEKFLPTCLEAVATQSYPNWEHILIDDCSTDSSWQILQAAAKNDSRIKIIKLSENSGAGVARNIGIEKAQGSHIAFLDSDDSWYPKKLELQMRFMEKYNHPFTFTSYDKIDEKDIKHPKIVKAKTRVSYKRALLKNPMGCLTVMYSVDYYGKQFMPEIRKRQDYALWLKLLKKSDAYGLQEVLASYRIRDNSISSNKLSLLKYEWQIYRKEEGLPFFTSLFYLVSAVVLKMKSYF